MAIQPKSVFRILLTDHKEEQVLTEFLAKIQKQLQENEVVKVEITIEPKLFSGEIP